MVVKTPVETAVSGVLAAAIALAPMFVFYGFEPFIHLVDSYLFLLASVVATVLLSWFIRSILDTNRTEYLLVWLVVPPLAVVIARLGFFPWWGGAPYPINVHPFAIMAAGLIGAVVEFGAARVVGRFPDSLGPVVEHKAILMVAVLLAPVVVAGALYATPVDATITGVDPVFNCGPDDAYPDRVDGGDCPTGLSHALAVTMETTGDPLRVVVETPAGVEHERWYAPGELNRGRSTVFLSAHTSVLEPPMVGTYSARAESIWGTVVDETTFEVERESTARITDVTVVGSNRTNVEVTVAYEGDFYIELRPLMMYFSETKLTFEEPFVFDGRGVDTVRATVIDDEGDPIALDPGEHEVDVSFGRIGARSTYSFVVGD